jgi:hypothetical protein
MQSSDVMKEIEGYRDVWTGDLLKSCMYVGYVCSEYSLSLAGVG